MKVTVLDFGIRSDARATLRLADAAERYGYHRYWLGEHRELSSAWQNPSPVVSAILARTKSIRAGVAGYMLAAHDGMDFVNDIDITRRMFAGRLDVGFVRGVPGSRTAVSPVDNLRTTLIGVLTRLRMFEGDMPSIWLLGGSRGTARLAGELGLRFGYCLFLAANTEDRFVLDTYHTAFRRSNWCVTPAHIVAVAGSCSEPGKVAHFENPHIRPTVVGAAATCAKALIGLARSYECNEVVFLELAASYERRRRSLHMLADALWGTGR